LGPRQRICSTIALTWSRGRSDRRHLFRDGVKRVPPSVAKFFEDGLTDLRPAPSYDPQLALLNGVEVLGGVERLGAFVLVFGLCRHPIRPGGDQVQGHQGDKVGL
jgi:hypothetical protein